MSLMNMKCSLNDDQKNQQRSVLLVLVPLNLLQIIPVIRFNAVKYLREASSSASCRLTFRESFSMTATCSLFSRSDTLWEHSCLIVSKSASHVCSISCSRLHDDTTQHFKHLSVVKQTCSYLNYLPETEQVILSPFTVWQNSLSTPKASHQLPNSR